MFTLSFIGVDLFVRWWRQNLDISQSDTNLWMLICYVFGIFFLLWLCLWWFPSCLNNLFVPFSLFSFILCENKTPNPALQLTLALCIASINARHPVKFISIIFIRRSSGSELQPLLYFRHTHPAYFSSWPFSLQAASSPMAIDFLSIASCSSVFAVTLF